jgi:hypothetical protein
VPLSVHAGRVTGLGEHLRHSDLPLHQSVVCLSALINIQKASRLCPKCARVTMKQFLLLTGNYWVTISFSLQQSFTVT